MGVLPKYLLDNMLVRNFIRVSVCVCVSQSLPMAVTSPVDIELCAVAVYQSKA